MAIREGRWDCSQCNLTGIKGRERVCPRCGDPRNQLLDPEEAAYLPDGTPPVTDQEGLSLADAGPSWNCGKCGHLNLGTESSCTACGEPIGHNDDVVPTRSYLDPEAAGDTVLSGPQDLADDRDDAVIGMTDPLRQLEDEPMRQPHRTLPRADLPDESADHLRARQEREETDAPAGTATAIYQRIVRRFTAASLRRRIIAATAAVLFLIIAVFGGHSIYANYFQTSPVTLTVQDLRWERGVEVEELRTLTLEDWIVPGDGRIISSRREIRRYDRVIDRYETRTRVVTERVLVGTETESYVCGTEDSGNGFFRDRYCTRNVPKYETRTRTEQYQEPIYRNDPVYDTKYTYQVDRWQTDYFERASGDVNPYWPEPTNLGSRQRIGDERQERYVVLLTDPRGRSINKNVNSSTWLVLDEGELVTGHQTRSGTIRRVDWPKQ